MKNQNLSLKIQKIRQIIKELDQLKNNNSAEFTSQLLKMMTDLLEEVDQRLTELENKSN
jgi:hypothetical protein